MKQGTIDYAEKYVRDTVEKKTRVNFIGAMGDAFCAFLNELKNQGKDTARTANNAAAVFGSIAVVWEKSEYVSQAVPKDTFQMMVKVCKNASKLNHKRNAVINYLDAKSDRETDEEFEKLKKERNKVARLFGFH